MWEEPHDEEQTKAVSCREIQANTERSTRTLHGSEAVRQQDTPYPQLPWALVNPLVSKSSSYQAIPQ